MDVEGLRNSKYPGPECWEPWEIERYVRGEKFPPERISHLDSCIGCHVLVAGMTPDPEMQKPPEPDCITKEELKRIREVGILFSDQRIHLSVCKRCKSNVYSVQEKFIEKTVPKYPTNEEALDFFETD